MRRALPLLAAIVLGVLTTIAIAWASAAWAPMTGLVLHRDSARAFGKPIQIEVNDFRGRTLSRREWHRSSLRATPGPTLRPLLTPARESHRALRHDTQVWGTVLAAIDDPDTLPRTAVVEDARGWPLLAFWCEIDVLPSAHRPRGGIRIAKSAAGPPLDRRLPFLPIPAGLAFNTAFFAAGWFGVIYAARLARHQRRLRRGLCTRCGYDLSGAVNVRCTECHTRCFPVYHFPPAL